jgi:hypothetical protein
VPTHPPLLSERERHQRKPHETKFSSFFFLVNIELEVLAKVLRQEKINIGKGEIKLYLLKYVIYVGNPKARTKPLMYYSHRTQVYYKNIKCISILRINNWENDNKNNNIIYISIMKH